MMIFNKFLLVLLGVAGVSCLRSSNYQERTDVTKPVFGENYYASGYIRLPYAEIVEPFEIFYQGKKNRSRIDVYTGMDKTYYRGDQPPNGNIYKVSPTTLKAKTPDDTCFSIPGGDKSHVQPQSLLPDLTHFQYYMTDVRAGQLVDLWQNITESTYFNISRKSVYTLAVSRTVPAAPVQYEMKGTNTLLGSHYDHYIIDYEHYNGTAVFSEETFDPPKKLTCKPFQKSIEQDIQCNPYREMINPEKGDRYHQLFDEFKQTFKKQYQSKEEHETRKGHFRKNVRLIHSVNRAKLSYGLAINHLADLSNDELKMMRGHRRSIVPNGGKPFDGSGIRLKDLPESIDWNVLGAVSPVKDQAICGSCWSFAAAEAIEGAYFNKYKQRVRLSQQMLVDCSWAYHGIIETKEYNDGCDGGLASSAFEWLQKMEIGLETEESYGPYLGQNGRCHSDKTLGVAHVKSHVNIQSGNQTALKMAVAQGPVAVAIDASHPTFSFYSYGVYYDPNCGNTPDDLDHAVLAVGYGTYNNQSYWLIKNSWSTYWGNNGYVMISMKDNNCGVATDANYPTVK